MPKIIQNRSKCIGCAVCVEMQPHIWRMSKMDGKATLINSKLKGSMSILVVREDTAQQAALIVKACPVKIIQVLA